MLFEGNIGVYGIAVLSFFFKRYFGILILMCGIAVSSSPEVCGFSSFWLTVFGKRRSFAVLRTVLLRSIQYATQNNVKYTG